MRICAAFKENSEITTTDAEHTVCFKKKKHLKEMQTQKETKRKKDKQEQTS